MNFHYPIDRDRPIEKWGRVVQAAQRDRTYTFTGDPIPRIPFGTGRSSGNRWPFCRDCAAARGELHVPGCRSEECPRCGGLFTACECAVEDDLEDGPREVQA